MYKLGIPSTQVQDLKINTVLHKGKFSIIPSTIILERIRSAIRSLGGEKLGFTENNVGTHSFQQIWRRHGNVSHRHSSLYHNASWMLVFQRIHALHSETSPQNESWRIFQNDHIQRILHRPRLCSQHRGW
jgi:hypothetical protein